MDVNRLRFLSLLGLAAVAGLSGCTAGQARGCEAVAEAGTLLASERHAGAIVTFRPAGPAEAGTIEVLRHRAGNGCRPELVDRYAQEGGEPRLEAVFVHPVDGRPNLFSIVSWPLVHVGLGMNGRLYAVHAYHETGAGLVPNVRVTRHRELHGGVVGVVDGEASAFEGATREGVTAMLARLGLE